MYRLKCEHIGNTVSPRSQGSGSNPAPAVESNH